MKIDLYITCPKCNKKLILKNKNWETKPTCENCLSSFDIILKSKEMKITFEEVDYLG